MLFRFFRKFRIFLKKEDKKVFPVAIILFRIIASLFIILLLPVIFFIIFIMKEPREFVSINDYIIEIKNKLFEKIRKLIDDYTKYDENIIYAEIVTPKFFRTDEEIEKLNEEIKFYIAHLDGINDNKEYKLVLSNKDKWTIFNLRNGTYTQI